MRCSHVARNLLTAVNAQERANTMPRLHRARTVACGLVKWGKWARIMVVHSVTRGWQDIRILLGVMGAMQPPIPCPTEGCLVISVMRSSRHFSKTYPRKGEPGRGVAHTVVASARPQACAATPGQVRHRRACAGGAPLSQTGKGTRVTRSTPQRGRCREAEHPQSIAPILPGPEGRGHTGVAQVFPERTALIVVQVGWHQGEEGLRGEHDELALRARHRHGQAPG